MNAFVCWVAMVVLGSGGYVHTDGFDYPDGTEGEPVWYAESVAWEVRDQQMVFDAAQHSFLRLEQAPHGRQVTVEATVTLQRRRGLDWCVAGIAVCRDGRNYWHLALVESPTKDGQRHFVELSEMLDGRWLAHTAPDTRLTPLAFQGTGFDWQYGRPYRLKLTLTGDRIDGFVFDADGGQKAHVAFRLDGPAVTAGQPALHCGGFSARFDDVGVKVSQLVPTPTAPARSYPAYAVPGFAGIMAKPTGFFYTKRIDGRWWLIDPKGRGFYVVGTDHVRYQGHWCQKLGYAPYGRNVQKKYGSEEKWAQATARRLADWGFNTLTVGHSVSLRYRRFAHIEFLSFGSTFAGMDDLCPKTTWTGFPNVFSPKWPRHCDKLARSRCRPVRDDPWLVGYFLDNELEWFGKNHRPWGLFDEAWKKPAGHSAKRAWVEFLKERLTDVGEFERHWGVRVADWEALAEHTKPAPPRTERAQQIARDWVRLVARRYFQTCREAVRRYDPNHLILGCRFAGTAPDIWDIAGRYCDVVSFNTYPRIDVDAGVPSSFIEQVREFHRRANKPLMVTEWSFPALDSGLPCRHGAGMRVDTQEQRARCFTHFQTVLFSLPFLVGSDFFMWVDEPALGISETFPEDTNYGLVNERDEPYRELTEAARRVNRRVYELHRAGRLPKWSPPPLRPWLVSLPDRWTAPLPQRLTLTTGPLRLEGPVGGRAWRLWNGSTLLGELFPLIHEQLPDDAWVEPDSARIVDVRQSASVTVVEMEFAKQPAAASQVVGPRGYRTRFRFWIPRRSSGWIASQCLWVQNTDRQPWRLGSVFHFLRPSIGGAPANDAPLQPNVPNYYRRGGVWADRQVGLGIGCWYQADTGFQCSYWVDPPGSFHADLRRRVDRRLLPGQRHEQADAPPAFFFVVENPTLSGWSQAVQRLKAEALARP